jgi:hypothetical protein
MKFRSGFVSNSSSSSFILVGVSFSSDEYEALPDDVRENLEDNFYVYDEVDEYLVGSKIASWDEEDGISESGSAQEFIEEMQQVQADLLKVLPSDKKINIYTGIIAS